MALVARWAELLRAEGVLPEHDLEEAEAQLLSDTLAALATGGPERDELLDAFHSARDSDDALRHALGSVLLPPAGYAVLKPDAYRQHPEVNFDAEQMPIRVALALPGAEDYVEPGQDPLDFGRSWFGGKPARPLDAPGWEWPARADGRPLTHVLQVDLADERLNQGEEHFALTGLPCDGIIQVFHDLETFGWGASDATGAWRILWHPSGGEDEDLELVDDGPDTVVPALPVNAQLLATVPSPLDLAGADDAEFDRYERAQQWLEQSAYEDNLMASRNRGGRTPWDRDYEALPPVSRLGGYGAAENNDELTAVLNQQLPLSAADHHVLLVDINPLAVGGEFADWFHARHLEVWIRRSDLEAKRFDDVWCVIRTDN